MSDIKAPRVIKRYANRKLYDLTESCYITHEEIANLVREGEEVRIIDNRTQEDLTSATLTQILLDEEKRVRRALPLDTLKNFFQNSGDFIQRHIKQPVVTLREEAEKNVRRVFSRKEELQELQAATSSAPASQPVPTADERSDKQHQHNRRVSSEALRELVEERWHEWQQALAFFDFPRRIAELERRVEVLEAKLAEHEK